MNAATRTKALRIALIAFGAIFTFGLLPLMKIWPSGWQWQPGQYEYEQMIVGVYAVLGIFMMLAARDPARHRSLILFAAWSSLAHAGIMGVQAVVDAAERGHLVGDVPALLVAGVVLAALAPRRAESIDRHRATSTSAGRASVPESAGPPGSRLR